MHSFGQLFNQLHNHLWNLQNVIYFIAIFMFLNGRRLVRSIALFYLSGILIGLSMSFLLFGYFLQRIIPIPRITGIPIFFGAWPISFYVYYWIWTNFNLILREYKLYALIYLCFFTLLSLAICYRIGPPVDIRTLNLAEWILQLVSLGIIYLLSQDQERAITTIVALVLYSLWRRYPGRIQYFIIRKWNWLSDFIFGPSPRKLLTEEEYREESRIFTQMELEKLRRFCHSQDSSKNWRLVSRLHKPNRMASFITGDNEHVSAEEQSRYSELYDYGDEWEQEEDDDELSGFITDDD